MPAVGEMDLSREEQSFFEAGDALDDTGPGESEARHRHRSRRRSSRHGAGRRIRRAIRRGGWFKATMSVILMIAAIGFGYWASMAVIDRSLPEATDLGVVPRGR
jgi:hypothetical protein